MICRPLFHCCIDFIVASISLGVWHSGPFTKPSLSLVPMMPFCHLASLPHSILHYRKTTFSSTCFLNCSLSANCSSLLLSVAAWQSHASEGDKGAISTCPGCQELAEGTTPEGTCVCQWQGSSRNKNAPSEASMENWQHRTLPPHWHVNPRKGGTTPKNRTWNPL